MDLDKSIARYRACKPPLLMWTVGNSGVAVASVDNTVYTKLNQAQPPVLNWALKLVS